MAKKLDAGNLNDGLTDGNLEQLFAAQGTVRSAQVIGDRETCRRKGFGFVEMDAEQETPTAVAPLNGRQVDGRALTVTEAQPRAEGRRGGPGGGRS
jgi:RNA recognition motif-containing protein